MKYTVYRLYTVDSMHIAVQNVILQLLDFDVLVSFQVTGFVHPLKHLELKNTARLIPQLSNLVITAD